MTHALEEYAKQIELIEYTKMKNWIWFTLILSQEKTQVQNPHWLYIPDFPSVKDKKYWLCLLIRLVND